MATVLITGTNRGIGYKFVQRYLERGDRVIATCRDIEVADDLQQLRDSHENLNLIQLDVSNAESMNSLPAALKGEAIDIFINNAGVYGPKNTEFGKVDAALWASVVQINSIAPLILTQLLIENLRKGSDKKLIYVTSKMGSIADNSGGGSYVYRSSKTALNSVVKSLSVDLGAEGFKAAVLHPGWVQTDMGGPNALIDTSTSVSGMMQVIDELTVDNSGDFINYDGSVIPW